MDGMPPVPNQCLSTFTNPFTDPMILRCALMAGHNAVHRSQPDTDAIHGHLWTDTAADVPLCGDRSPRHFATDVRCALLRGHGCRHTNRTDGQIGNRWSDSTDGNERVYCAHITNHRPDLGTLVCDKPPSHVGPHCDETLNIYWQTEQCRSELARDDRPTLRCEHPAGHSVGQHAVDHRGTLPGESATYWLDRSTGASYRHDGPHRNGDRVSSTDPCVSRYKHPMRYSLDRCVFGVGHGSTHRSAEFTWTDENAYALPDGVSRESSTTSTTITTTTEMVTHSIALPVDANALSGFMLAVGMAYCDHANYDSLAHPPDGAIMLDAQITQDPVRFELAATFTVETSETHQ